MKQKIRLTAIVLGVAMVASFFIFAPPAAAQDKTVRWKIQTCYPLAVP